MGGEIGLGYVGIDVRGVDELFNECLQGLGDMCLVWM